MESCRATVGALRGEEIDADIAPSLPAGELRDRHELDGVDAQVEEVVEACDRGVERAFWCERADVQLVDDCRAERKPSPYVEVAPARGFDESRSPVNACRLPPRTRIRHRLSAIDTERIVIAGGEVGIGREPAASRLLHRERPGLRDQLDGRRRGRPEADPPGGHARSSSATGASSSKVARRCSPPRTSCPVSASRQRPSGR